MKNMIMKIKAKWNKMMKEIERLAEYLDEVNEDNY
jgi:hypothetical protein